MAELSESKGDTSSALITFLSSGEVRQSAATASGKNFDLLDFLGVAQRLRLDFLPVTWQLALDTVGEGGTAEIRQAAINHQTSFAFKLLKRTSWATGETQNLRALLAEVAVLGHWAIRYGGHTNFEGICWDVGPGDEDVWPVLVSEKSRYGNLNNFMASGSGKALSFEDRVELLFYVADAVRILHATGIIHGDIKPENVLIYRESDGRYIAKVIDFGYSTLFAEDNDPIRMPCSRPWTAPEWHHRQILPALARKMDAYSFGMLCLWLLFYNRLDQDRKFKKDLEGSQISVLSHAFNLIRDTADSEYQDMNNVRDLFRLTLAQDSAERASDFATFVQLLSSNQAFIVEIAYDRLSIPDHEFQIAFSLKQLIETHYRVRQCIAKTLLTRIGRCSTSPCHALNLAFCYELGFGVPRDALKSKMLLKENNIPSENLEKVIDELKIDPYLSKLRENRLDFRRDAVMCEKSSEENEKSIQHLQRFVEELKKNPEHHKFVEPRYRSLLTQGHFSSFVFIQQYRKERRLQEAETCYQREILSIGSAIGNDHVFVQELRRQLYVLMMSERRFGEAESLAIRMIEMDKGITDEGRYTGGFVPHLAVAYHMLGRYTEAEELQVQVLEGDKKAYGQEHLCVVRSMVELGRTYWAQGRLEEAEKLQVQVLEMSRKSLGMEHEDTLDYSNDLGVTYMSQGRIEEAEELQLLVLETSKRVTDIGNAMVLDYMHNLAENYCLQHRWRAAEELEIKVLERSKDVLGMDHATTVAYMNALGSNLFNQGRWKEAEELLLQALARSKKALGIEHTTTLTCMVHLGVLYFKKGRWIEAEELQVRLVETSKKMGMPDGLRMNYMTSLASNYTHQGRWEEAEDLQVQVLEMSKKILGVEHPYTLTYTAYLAATYRSQHKDIEAACLEAQGKGHEKSDERLAS